MPNPTQGTAIGQYEIEATIGAGSMGDVFRGIDVSLKRKVAIKILSEKHRESPELRARFIREGRAVAAIQHPNVVQVFTTGVYDERPFIAMELLDGTDLGTLVEDNGPLPSLVAARMMLDAARGLQAAAKAGLIHRDVKPSNLVQLTDGRVKVTDFGLAKPVDPGTEPALTALGVVVGTPDYIAPEQARGDAIDERVDIYALGGTLYYLLIGTPPFRTGKPAEDKYLKVVARHLRQPPPDARVARPEVDEDLSEIVRAMMAKKPTERPDYTALIAKFEAVIKRLSAKGDPSVSYPRSTDGSGGMTSKTPFVGGGVPHGFRDDATDLVRKGGPSPDASLDGSSLGVTRPGLPRWLIVVSVLAFLVLAAGAGVYFLGGGSGKADGGMAPVVTLDAAPASKPPDAAPARPAKPTPPAGMALVEKPDGTPWFFVDVAPVTHGAYARAFPKQKKPSPALDPQAVTGVAYNFARAYAQMTDKRLLTAGEYDAAITAAGVEPLAAAAWEWVDSGDAEKKTVRGPGRKATRAQTGQKDVTFRLARDL